MLSHPESERLAWERVRALEEETKRLRAHYVRALNVLMAWSRTLRRRQSDPEVNAVLTGLAFALDETAEKLAAAIG